jgi:uncharacterized membrane protein HdeD (DUF308 family)
MQDELKSSAWALGLWGALSIIFGVLIVAWPGITLKAFLLILGVYLLASGAVMLIGSLIRRTGHWIIGALIGFLGFVAGLYVFAHPKISALAVLVVIAVWAITVGMLQIVSGFIAERKDWWMVVAGIVYAVFGFWVFANPKDGAIALVWLIGLSAVAVGILLAVSAFEVSKLDNLANKKA